MSYMLPVLQGPARTSGLLAPIMLLTGHAGEVFTAKFNPTGDVVASGSHDKHIFLWRTYGECENYMMIKGVSCDFIKQTSYLPNGQIVKTVLSALIRPLCYGQLPMRSSVTAVPLVFNDCL